MTTLRNTGLLLALLLALGGCSSPYRIAGVQSGASTDEVARQAGKPAGTWREGAVEIWEYPAGPVGMHTYFARFDAGGRLVEVRQVLTEDNFKRVNAGATRESVHHLLGKPGYVERYPRINEEVWSWRFSADRSPRLFNVHFDQGSAQVKHTTYSVDPDEISYIGGGPVGP